MFSSPAVSADEVGNVVDAVEAREELAVPSGIDGKATSPARKIPFTTPRPPVPSSSSSISSSSNGATRKVSSSLLNFFNKPSSSIESKNKAVTKTDKKEKSEEDKVKEIEENEKAYSVINIEDSCSGLGQVPVAVAAAAQQ